MSEQLSKADEAKALGRLETHAVDQTRLAIESYAKSINDGTVASRGAIAAESVKTLGQIEQILGTSYEKYQARNNPSLDKSGEVKAVHEVRGAIDYYYDQLDQLTKEGNVSTPAQEGMAAKASLNMIMLALKIEQPQPPEVSANVSR